MNLTMSIQTMDESDFLAECHAYLGTTSDVSPPAHDHKLRRENMRLALAAFGYSKAVAIPAEQRERFLRLIGALPAEAAHLWDGSGLVPVGTICHCGTHNREVEILQVTLVPYASAACRATDNNELFWGGDFTPIPTPEQIAAEKRDKAINAMLDLFEAAACKQSYDMRAGIAAIYDAGCRLPEEADHE